MTRVPIELRQKEEVFFTKVTQHLFDTVFSQVLWTLDPSTNFRIAQVRVYQHLS